LTGEGMKRSVAYDGDGLPLHLLAARANDHDSPLLEPTLAEICHMIGPLPDGRACTWTAATTPARLGGAG
jgi:hypothetical protein